MSPYMKAFMFGYRHAVNSVSTVNLHPAAGSYFNTATITTTITIIIII